MATPTKTPVAQPKPAATPAQAKPAPTAKPGAVNVNAKPALAPAKPDPVAAIAAKSAAKNGSEAPKEEETVQTQQPTPQPEAKAAPVAVATAPASEASETKTEKKAPHNAAPDLATTGERKRKSVRDYNEKINKMTAPELATFRLSNIYDRVLALGEQIPEDKAAAFKEKIAQLGDSVAGLIEEAKQIPADLKLHPAKKSGKGSGEKKGRAKKAKLEMIVGATVAIKDSHAADYDGLIDASLLKSLNVVLIRDQKIGVKATDGQRFFIPRKHLSVISVPEAPASPANGAAPAQA